MARQIDWVIFLLRFVLTLIPVLIFPVSFIWRLLCDVLGLRKRPEGSSITSLFLVTIDSTGQSLLKPSLLGYGKFPVLLKHMSPDSLLGAAVSAAVAAGVHPSGR